jgi:hypothetical protein
MIEYAASEILLKNRSAGESDFSFMALDLEGYQMGRHNRALGSMPPVVAEGSARTR